MKKFILLMLMFLGMMVMAEKLNTDGKSNLDKLKGTWRVKGADGSNIIRFFKGKWQLGYECWDDEKECMKEPDYDRKSGMNFYDIKEVKNGVLVVFFDKNLKQYFAYDTRKKALVFLDDKLNIDSILSWKIE
ncbi:MAG: hypothetical protein LBV03_01685 [Fusobacteriales bacterium]|jgi:hypothetical protein|nr:hypothetical protein [Fusobacteriales bacterium]